MTAGSVFAATDGFCIVADDLTGALDTAGSLASPSQPFEVPLGDAPPRGTRIALDTDSRDLGEDEAGQRVARAIEAFAGRDGALVFKKIDSVMRGHPVAETVAALRAGRFDRVLVAPAFPALGRVTRNGRQFVLGTEGAWAVGPSLPEAFGAHGLSAIRLGDADRPGAVYVVDAEDDAELHRAARSIGALGGRTLYVGSAGLAQALAAGAAAPIDVPRLDLAICGTAHPVTLAQVESLARLAIAVEPMTGGPLRHAGFPRVHIAPGGVFDEGAARRLIAQSLAALTREGPAPRTALVTGGWTLRALLQAADAGSLVCLGLYRPGIPVSRVVGGRWHDTMIVSKSGGFGEAGLLHALFQPAPEAGAA
ncbi:four-carbon acid sugar kinase family protein [Aureimonas glaciei]|uniref:Four-carbon acid sugar kinase family protein n=1 Tax=Aureimonas glaciei TaxID=1776957 RepID=A0A917DDP8_9HYPH|nr:four-carbon acid sugar kinase family protein [Aureimonas glaciei]GGD29405.1 hypothetical protein GCM10011335_35670 [Aureimonas glaciei]